MELSYIRQSGCTVAELTGPEPVLTGAQSALELAMAARSAVAEDFFILSTGLAGEILQKFVNYQVKMAVYGDFSRYTSKPLRDFIHESNQGEHFWFVPTREEALRRLREG